METVTSKIIRQMTAKKIITVLVAACISNATYCDADKDFPLPDIMLPPGCKIRISSAQEWENTAYPQIIDFFENQIYGEIPPRPEKLEFRLVESSDDALGGIAKRRQYKIISADKNGSHSFDVLVYLPKTGEGKLPAFIYPNFKGNHSVSPESEVIAPSPEPGGKGNGDIEGMRGKRLGRLPVKDIVSNGFAVATFYYESVYPDSPSGAEKSVYAIFPEEKRGQKTAIPAWAWGDIRTCDLLESMPEIDAKRIALAGHSRLAKTAVFAAACDKRFALACINGGGCKRLCFLPNLRFEHWFSQNLKRYVENEKTAIPMEELRKLCMGKAPLPAEQYSLIACIAPRPLYISTAKEDVYATPKINFEAAEAVIPVYRLFGSKSFAGSEFEESPDPFFGDIAYHCKEGKHSITPEDWKNFMDYAEKVNLINKN